VAGASGRRRGEVLEAVLDEPPLVPLLDELEVQGDHLLLQLRDRGLEDADVGEQLLRLQMRERRDRPMSATAAGEARPGQTNCGRAGVRWWGGRPCRRA